MKTARTVFRVVLEVEAPAQEAFGPNEHGVAEELHKALRHLKTNRSVKLVDVQVWAHIPAPGLRHK